MRWLMLSCLFFTAGVWAKCEIPARFTEVENPPSAEIFSFTPVDGKKHPVQLLNIWALWCPPCRAELPLLAQMNAEGIPVFLVNMGDDQDAAKDFLTEVNAQNLPQSRIEDSDLLSALGVTGFPATFLLENGTLRYRTQGALTSTDYQVLQAYASCVLSL